MTRSNLRRITWSTTCLLIGSMWVMAMFAEDQAVFFADLLGVEKRYAVPAASLISMVGMVVIPALVTVFLYFARMWAWIIRNPRKLVGDPSFQRFGVDLLLLIVALSALILCALMISSGNHSHFLGLSTFLLLLFTCFWVLKTLLQFLKVFDNLAGQFTFVKER